MLKIFAGEAPTITFSFRRYPSRVVVDISGTASYALALLFPDGTTEARTQSADFALVTDGEDGLLSYTAHAADFPDIGDYQLQAKVTRDSEDLFSEVNQVSVSTAIEDVVAEAEP